MQSTYTRITVQNTLVRARVPAIHHQRPHSYSGVVGAYREQQGGDLSHVISLILSLSRRRKQKNVRIFQDEMEPTGRLLSLLDVHNYVIHGFVIDNTAMDGLFYSSIFEKKLFFKSQSTRRSYTYNNNMRTYVPYTKRETNYNISPDDSTNKNRRWFNGYGTNERWLLSSITRRVTTKPKKWEPSSSFVVECTWCDGPPFWHNLASYCIIMCSHHPANVFLLSSALQPIPNKVEVIVGGGRNVGLGLWWGELYVLRTEDHAMHT